MHSHFCSTYSRSPAVERWVRERREQQGGKQALTGREAAGRLPPPAHPQGDRLRKGLQVVSAGQHQQHGDPADEIQLRLRKQAVGLPAMCTPRCCTLAIRCPRQGGE